MNITIEIECETIADFYSHLTELRAQIKRQARKLKLTPVDEFPPDVDLYDDNCYGTHNVTIKLERP